MPGISRRIVRTESVSGLGIAMVRSHSGTGFQIQSDRSAGRGQTGTGVWEFNKNASETEVGRSCLSSNSDISRHGASLLKSSTGAGFRLSLGPRGVLARPSTAPTSAAARYGRIKAPNSTSVH